ncbi:unnamed protein product [Prunus armeniaca]
MNRARICWVLRVREEACSLDVVVLANDEVVGCWVVSGSSTKTLSSFGKVYQKEKWEEMEGWGSKLQRCWKALSRSCLSGELLFSAIFLPSFLPSSIARSDGGKEMGMYIGLKGVLLKYPLVFWMFLLETCSLPYARASQQLTDMDILAFIVAFARGGILDRKMAKTNRQFIAMEPQSQETKLHLRLRYLIFKTYGYRKPRLYL